MCYNVLCDKYATRQLYGYCPSWALNWEYRKKGIMEEIVNCDADIISLQVTATELWSVVVSRKRRVNPAFTCLLTDSGLTPCLHRGSCFLGGDKVRELKLGQGVGNLGGMLWVFSPSDEHPKCSPSGCRGGDERSSPKHRCTCLPQKLKSQKRVVPLV